MIISSIVAVSNNHAIGVDNDLPWHMPADLKYFKEKTIGHHVLMGRKSFDSVGRPLPGRTNIVVTRNKEWNNSSVIVVHSIPDGILVAQNAGVEELFILGGSNIYFQTQELWDKLYLTKINTEISNATAFFPELDMEKWKLSREEPHKADEKNAFDYNFCLYERPWANDSKQL